MSIEAGLGETAVAAASSQPVIDGISYITPFVTSFTTGAIASLIASAMFLYYTKKQLPNITMSSDIIIDSDPNSEVKSLAIKFVNLSPNSLVDVSVILYGNTYQNADKSMSTFRILSEKKVPFIPGFDEADTKMQFATVATLPVEISIEELKEQYHAVSVKIIGQEAYYGTYATESKCYQLQDIKENSFFELGENINTRTRD